MTRFDYLRDAPPVFIERLHPSRLAEELRTPLAALATTAIVILVWWGIETMQIAQARTELAMQRARAIASRTDLAQARVQRAHLADLIALDKRIREIRRSGTTLARRLADIANHIPDRAWLTSISRADQGVEIEGNAIGLDGLSETLASLMSSSTAASPALVRAARSDRPSMQDVISFELRAEGRAP